MHRTLNRFLLEVGYLKVQTHKSSVSVVLALPVCSLLNCECFVPVDIVSSFGCN